MKSFFCCVISLLKNLCLWNLTKNLKEMFWGNFKAFFLLSSLISYYFQVSLNFWKWRICSPELQYKLTSFNKTHHKLHHSFFQYGLNQGFVTVLLHAPWQRQAWHFYGAQQKAKGNKKAAPVSRHIFGTRPLKWWILNLNFLFWFDV